MTMDPRSGSAAVPRLVLVLGVARSGTSLFTSVLGRLGFHIPQPEVRADDTNPRGFGEPRWVVDFHSSLMRTRRVTVFDSRPAAWEIMAEATKDDGVFKDLRSWLAVQFVGTDNVVVKDPRTGWFLPLWLRCADDLGVEISFATTLRYPPEVVSSARRWYGTWQSDPSRAAAWLNHTLQTEYATRGAARAFIRYEDLLDDWPREISRVAELLGLHWLVGIDRSSHPDVDALVDPSLRRSAVGWEETEVPPALQSRVEDVWRTASGLADPNGDGEAARTSLDVARASYAEFYAEAEAIAQSSVTALKPRRWDAGTLSAPPRRAGGAHGERLSLGMQIARRIPAPYQERVRLVARGVVLTRGLRLLLGVLLLIPPRYRERVPVPVVRAGFWIFRSLRR
jgi:hypothetical protein